MSTFYSPLRYPGGKNCIFPFMATLLHENELEGGFYAEPFAGGAGLALHLLMEGHVSQVHLNDFDHSIFSFWHAILNHTEQFCEWIQNVPVNMETWNWAKNIHSNYTLADDLELAKATFFLNRTNVSGIIMGGPIGGPLQKGKYKIDVRFNKKDLIDRIKEIAKFKKSIFLYEMDGLDFIKLINKKRKNFFIYIDPPYVKKGSDLYMNFFEETQHKDLRDMILMLKKSWLISYDNNQLINILYSSFNRICYTLSQCTSNKMGQEIIIYPDSLKVEAALSKIKSPIKLNLELELQEKR